MIEKLKEVLIEQGKKFLEEFGEFFPFATAISFEGKIVPVGIYFGEDNPLSEEVLLQLETALKAGKDEKRYKMVGICTNVFVTPPGESDKIDAFELRIDGQEIERINIYVPYEVKEGHVDFLKSYSETGSLILW